MLLFTRISRLSTSIEVVHALSCQAVLVGVQEAPEVPVRAAGVVDMLHRPVGAQLSSGFDTYVENTAVIATGNKVVIVQI